MIPMHGPGEAVAEARRSVNKLNIICVKSQIFNTKTDKNGETQMYLYD
jgi:hypothetical protein